MAAIESLILGSETRTGIFGSWPSSHDECGCLPSSVWICAICGQSLFLGARASVCPQMTQMYTDEEERASENSGPAALLPRRGVIEPPAFARPGRTSNRVCGKCRCLAGRRHWWYARTPRLERLDSNGEDGHVRDHGTARRRGVAYHPAFLRVISSTSRRRGLPGVLADSEAIRRSRDPLPQVRVHPSRPDRAALSRVRGADMKWHGRTACRPPLARVGRA